MAIAAWLNESRDNRISKGRALARWLHPFIYLSAVENDICPKKEATPNAASSYVTPDGKWDFSSTRDYYCYTAATSQPMASCQYRCSFVIAPSIKCHFSVTVRKF
jgi:hypothetical protein